MNADDFRDYMLSFLFLRYLSDNYEQAARRRNWARTIRTTVNGNGGRRRCRLWYAANPDDVAEFEKQMRRKVHYVIKPEHLWANIVHLARTQNDELLNTLQEGFKYIEEESFQSNFQGLFSEINLGSDKLGRRLRGPQRQALLDHQRDRRGAGGVLDRRRHARRRLRVPDRPVRRRLGQEGGRVLHAAADLEHPLGHRHARQPGAEDRQARSGWTACSTSPAARARCC